MKDFTKITLGELLSNMDEIIRRNAISILKRLQQIFKDQEKESEEIKQTLFFLVVNTTTSKSQHTNAHYVGFLFNNMKVEKRHYNEKTGQWESTFVEEEGDFVFSTHTNVPVEKLKKSRKNEKSTKNRNI